MARFLLGAMGDGTVSLRGDVGLARFSVQAIVYGTVSLRGDVGLARFLLGALWGQKKRTFFSI